MRAMRRLNSRVSRFKKSLAKAFPNNTDYQLDLVESLAEFSVFSTALDVEIADAAEKRLRRALKRGQLLVAKRPDMALYSLIVAHAHFKLAAVYEFQAQFLNPSDRHQKLDAAEDEIVQAIDLMYDIHMKFPDAVGFAAWLAYFESRCGRIQNQLRRFDDAHRTFAIAIERLESMPTIGSDADNVGLLLPSVESYVPRNRDARPSASGRMDCGIVNTAKLQYPSHSRRITIGRWTKTSFKRSNLLPSLQRLSTESCRHARPAWTCLEFSRWRLPLLSAAERFATFSLIATLCFGSQIRTTHWSCSR